jgi:LCP family protein required for cell wall assembly
MPRDRERPPYRAAHIRRSASPDEVEGDDRRDPRHIRVEGARRSGGSGGSGRSGRSGGLGGSGGSGRSRRERRGRRSWAQRSLIGLGAFIVVLALSGTAVAAWLVLSLGKIDRYDEVSTDSAGSQEPRNYLVVGSDSRAKAKDGEYGNVTGQRSDTIMVVRLDPKSNHADMLSIPRDLIVPIAGTGKKARINTAYSLGREVLVDTLRDNFNIEINHYVEVDFQGFKKLVDAIGGVSIWVDDAIRDKASGLYVTEHGCVTLDGKQALAFARSRHLQYMTPDGWSRQDPYADLGRIQRQQVFVRRALTKALDEAKSDPFTFKDLVNIGVNAVGVDADTDPLGLAREFKDFDPDDLTTYSLPVKDSGNHATVVLDKPKAAPVLKIFGGTDEGDGADAADAADVAPSSITVSVRNGTSAAGRAAEVANDFAAAGFGTGMPGNIAAHAKTTVYHRAGEVALGNEVARYIAGGAEVLERDDLDLRSGEVIVAIGEDFIRVLDTPAKAETTTTTSGSAGSGGTGDGATTTTGSESSPAYDEFTIGDPPAGKKCD